MKKGWQTKKLGDVCDFEGGSQPPKSEFIYDEKTGYLRFLQIRDFGSDKNITYIRHSKKNRLCDENDILIGRYGASVGKILTGKSGAYNVALMKTIPNLEVLDQSWFYHFLISDEFQKPLLNVADRSAQAGFSKDDIYNFLVPVPPLSEQQRIVGLLDEAFEGLATAKANAEKNLQNARALFESHLQSVFADHWQIGELVTLADLATDITDGDHLPPPKSPTGVPFITIGNIVKETREIDFSDTFMVPRAYFDALKPYKKPRQGDVLYTVTGSFGIPVIVRDDTEFCFQRHIGLVRPKPETSSSWLYYLLRSPPLLKQANDGATGTAQKTVSLKLLRSFEVPRVSPNQQKQAVEKLDALTEETQRLARLYERKLAALEALKKSLLNRAFTGELNPNTP
jgi:type I restriction enzyme S subunit